MTDRALLVSSLKREHTVTVLESVSSTNTEASAHAVSGAPDGDIVVAGLQTGGYGRAKRSFFSPAGSGIYFSIVLRKPLTPAFITCAAACAVSECLEELSGTPAYIKWVNDIYMRGKKVCGILAQRRYLSESSFYTVLGIGINLFEPEGGFPADISQKAGAAFISRSVRAESVLAGVINRFDSFYFSGDGDALYQSYCSRMFLSGRTVTVSGMPGDSLSETYKAEVIGVNRDFSLSVRKDGEILSLNSGEVTLKL